MTLQDYQQKAMSTCMITCDNFSYMMLNLVGEVGELASKVAKAIRSADAYIYSNDLEWSQPRPDLSDLKKETGDILWQLSGLCSAMGWSLEEIAQMNLDKLASRQQRGVIDGNGDER